MNLLKHITIEGDLHYAYVRLFTEYEFCNESDDLIAPEYFFPVPSGAVITDFQIMRQDKKLLRASVQTIVGTKLSDSGLRLVQVHPQIYCLRGDTISSTEVYSVLTEMVLPLKMGEGTAEIVLPLGIRTGKSTEIYSADCTVGIILRSSIQNLHGTSPTHTILTETANENTIFKVTTNTRRDAVIYIDGFKRDSFGMISEGVGLYRIHTKNKDRYVKKIKKRVLLLLDLSGAGTEKKANVVKELLYRTIGALELGCEVQILSAEGRLFSDFTVKDESFCDKIFEQLSGIQNNGCRLYDLMTAGAELRTADTNIVLISSDLNLNRDTAACFELFSEPVHVFEVGSYEVSPGVYKSMKGVGVYEHFYYEELTAERVLEAVKRIGEWGAEFQITAMDASVSEIIPLSETGISVDGHKDFVLRYIGRPPHSFTLWQDGEAKETVTVSDIEIYNNFPVLEKLYAGAIIRSLTALLNKLPLDSCRMIKEQIEQIGVKTGIVTSETIIAVPQENGGEHGIPVILYSGVPEEIGDFIQRPTVFGERDARVQLDGEEKKRLLELCTRIIRRSVRSDGAVAADGCMDLQNRANQTAFASAAMQMSGQKTEAAFKYLSRKPPCGFAAQLYLHRENFAEFVQGYRAELLKELPDFMELLRQLSCRGDELYAAAQIILRIYLSDLQ